MTLMAEYVLAKAAERQKLAAAGVEEGSAEYAEGGSVDELGQALPALGEVLTLKDWIRGVSAERQAERDAQDSYEALGLGRALELAESDFAAAHAEVDDAAACLMLGGLLTQIAEAEKIVTQARRARIRKMRAEGMTLRAIAVVTGVAYQRVAQLAG